MRASEFTKQELDEKVNPQVVEPGFTAEKRLGNRYVLNAGKVDLRSIMKNLSTTESKANGRINKDTIILRIVK